MTQDDDNPYRSPRTALAHQTPVVPRGRDGVAARLMSKGWLYRKIAIQAPIDAVIEYRGRGFGESIYVDGQRAIWNTSWFFSLVPLFEFALNADGLTLPIAVHVRTSPWMTLKAFRIDINGTTTYVEGQWPNTT